MYDEGMNMTKHRVYSITDDQNSRKIKPVFNDFHNLRMDGEYEYPRHCHDNYEVIVVDTGPYFCNLNNVELTVKDSQFLVVKPGDFHQDHLYSNQSHFVLHLSIQIEDVLANNQLELLRSNILPEDQIYPIGNGWQPISFFEEIEKNNSLKDKYSYKIQEPLMELFFWNMIRCIPDTYLSVSFKDISNNHLFRSKLLNLFDLNYNRSLSVNEMSSKMNMSKRNLSIYCMNYFNDSPAKLFIKYKLDKAVELLRSGTLNIKDISDHLGFDNQFHFSRVFKRIYNVAPSKLLFSTI